MGGGRVVLKEIITKAKNDSVSCMSEPIRRSSTDIQGVLESDTSARAAGVTTELSAGDWPSIGIYQSQAGTRDASGITIYVQELVDRLAELTSTYLYTKAGPFTEKIDESDAEIVSFGQYRVGASVYRVLSQFANSFGFLSAEVSETIRSFVNAVQEGVIDHIETNVDVLVTHNIMDSVLLSNVVDVPVIRVFHTCQQVGIGSKVLKFLSQTATTVANSQQTAHEISDRLGYEPSGIVHPGVDIERFTPDRTPAFESPNPVVMFVGRFVQEKRVFDLLEAFAEMSMDGNLYLVGRGDESRIADRITELGVSQSVTIVGEVPHDDLPHYYAAADVVCLPSYYESFGMVNLEAMASGTPVITSDVAGIREYATDRETCLLIPPGNPDRLAAGLEELLASPALRAKLGAAGREVSEQYSWQESAETLARICTAELQ